MADIKIKETKPKYVKQLDKKKIGTEKLKNNLLHTKEKINSLNDSNKKEDENVYAVNKISKLPNKYLKFNKYGKKYFNQTVTNIKNATQKVKAFKEMKKTKKIAKINTPLIKNTPTKIKTSQTTVKNNTTSTKKAIEKSKKAIQKAKAISKATAKTIKATAKAIITGIKALIAGTKAIFAAIVGGGWIVVIVVIIICIIGALCNSFLGIFFSSEDINKDGNTMSAIISEINNEYINKITEIQNSVPHDEYHIDSNRAEWSDVLAIYVALVTKGTNQAEVMTVDNNKKETLKKVFWEMNAITYNTQIVNKDIETTDENGNTVIENKDVTVLNIIITHKTVDEMMQIYNFNDNQREQVKELLNGQFVSMWSRVMYGSSVGNNDIVEVAKKHLGNVGGQPFWSWYGFNSRVAWCACFVSYCANECGFINAGIIPKFASCQGEGIPWFKTCGLWQNRGYSPKSGDIIFFDWEGDGTSDHVGIVESCDGNTVYTIEGNSNDACKERSYPINSSDIVGYGTPLY